MDTRSLPWGTFIATFALIFVSPLAAQAATVIFLTSGTSWTVPSDWNSASNTIECIGGGGGGAAITGSNFAVTGGGGGGYSAVSNQTYTPGHTISYAVGAAGAGSSAGSGTAGGDSSIKDDANSANVCLAKGGAGGTIGASSATGVAGGSSASGIGTTKYSGGASGSDACAPSGGGGAAGPNGAGKAGGDGAASGTNGCGGGGGGGANNGTAGSQGVPDGAGGAGGNGRGGSGGGSAGVPDGGNGSNGGGGGGGGLSGSLQGRGGAGGQDSLWTQTSNSATAGPGGGGGGGSAGIYSATSFDGGAGALYGGGGGAAGYNTGGGLGVGGNGAQGIIVITYTPVSGITLTRPPNNLGLIGFWSFDDATGTKATDFSGNGNTGTLTNIANPPTASSGWTSGKLGHALNLDGTNDYVNAGNSSLFNFTSGSFTISFWVKAGNQGHDIDFVGRRTGTTQGWAIETNGSVPEFCSNTTCVDATKAYNDNTWHLITLSRSGTSLSFYRDGVLDVTRTISNMSSVSTNLTFGVSLDVALYLNGTLDEMRIYNRSLSAGEIQKLYQSSVVKLNTSSVELQKGTTLANGLVAHWTFDGNDVSDKVYDRSGNGNNAYFVGSATTSAKVPGRLGQALSFDGSSNYVLAGDIAALDGASQMSVSAWTRASASASIQTIVGKFDASANGWVFAIDSSDCTGTSLMFQPTSASGYACAALGNHQLGAWEHVVAVFDGTQATDASKLKIYFNGDPLSTTFPGGAVGTAVDSHASSVSIGANFLSSFYTFFYSGAIDDVRIYNRALSAAEVKQLYTLGQTTIKH